MALHEISLKWNGHKNNILTNVQELFLDEGLSDVTLVSEGQSFRAHKVILSASSSLFKGIFQQNPQKDPIIILHNVNITSMKTLLAFMYNGEVNVTEEFLPTLLTAADTLRIRGLCTGPEYIEEEKTVSSPPKKRKWFDNTAHSINVDNECGKSTGPSTEAINSTSFPSCFNSQKAVVPKTEPIEVLSPETVINESIHKNGIQEMNPLSAKIPKIFSEVNPILKTGNNDDCSTMKSLKKSRCENINSIGKVSLGVESPSVSNNSVDKMSDDDKDVGADIEREIVKVLHSETAVESLGISTEHMNCKASENHSANDKSIGQCYSSPLFPCPFCSRIYNSWGYRRRHVKSRHYINRLACKLCHSVQTSQASWFSHATRAHGLGREEARNALVVLVEAHAVLTLAEPALPQLLHQIDVPEAHSDEASTQAVR